MVKTTGAEFRRFYQDKNWWDNDSGNIWVEDETIIINGQEQTEGVELDAINDSDAVVIDEGSVFGLDDETSLETYFRRWRKKQNTVSFLVECDISKRDGIKAAIKAAGGRVAS